MKWHRLLGAFPGAGAGGTALGWAFFPRCDTLVESFPRGKAEVINVVFSQPQLQLNKLCFSSLGITVWVKVNSLLVSAAAQDHVFLFLFMFPFLYDPKDVPMGCGAGGLCGSKQPEWFLMELTATFCWEDGGNVQPFSLETI